MPILEKKKRVVRLETSVCFRITMLMNNQTKSQRKATIPTNDDTNAVSIVKTVSQLGCVSQHSDALVSQGRKSRGNPMQKVLEPIQRVRFTQSTPRQTRIWEKKGRSLGKLNVKSSHQRSPYALTMKRLKDSSDVPDRSKAWNLAKNICKLKK